jgi:hypothetical protein
MLLTETQTLAMRLIGFMKMTINYMGMFMVRLVTALATSLIFIAQTVPFIQRNTLCMMPRSKMLGKNLFQHGITKISTASWQIIPIMQMTTARFH